MSGFLGRLISDDFVWDAITRHLSGRLRRSGTNFININCPLCGDQRGRCGIKQKSPGVLVSCFNCRATFAWYPGELLNRKIQEFLVALGMGEREVKQLNLAALQRRRLIENSPAAQALIPITMAPMVFPAARLPEGAASIADWAEQGCENPDFLDVAEYMFSRGDAVADHQKNLYWAPSGLHGMSRRLLVPFTHEGMTVGYTGRAIDPMTTRRYDSQSPTNYLYNTHVLRDSNRRYGVLVEGVFDALALDAVGSMGARLSTIQANWLRSFGKQIIVCPDRDKAGAALVDVALEQGWSVAFVKQGATKWWDDDVKDAAEACKRYGRLYTLASVIESMITDKKQIEQMRRQNYAKA